MTTAFSLSPSNLKYYAWFLDVCILTFTAAASAHFYLGAWVVIFDFSLVYLQLIILASLMLLLWGGRIYRSWRVIDIWVILGAISWVTLMGIMFLILFLFIMKKSAYVSRAWFLIWCVSSWGALLLNRWIIYFTLHWLRRKGYNYKKLLLVGVGPISQRVLEAVDAAGWSGINIVGVVEPAKLEAWLNEFKSKQPNEIWICLPMSDDTGIHQVLNILRHSFSNIRLVPDLFSLRHLNLKVSNSLGMPMFDLSISPVTRTTRIVKTLEDIIISAIILLSISPMFLLIAFAIKVTSMGPILFKQKRLGWNGAEIIIYKFRTMYVSADSYESFKQAQRNDIRVTKLGHFLRKTSLDELPQFINVLQGRMSIVGPRPHAIAHNDQFKELVPKYMLRHRVKPGITGWAQIHGYRGETDTLVKMMYRVEYDLYYIENMSIWLDLRIIFMTILKGFIHKNAY